MIPAGLKTFAFDARWRFVLFEELSAIRSEREVLCGVALAFAAEVSPKATSSTQCSLFSIAPVLADDAVQLCGIGLEAGDVVAVSRSVCLWPCDSVRPGCAPTL